MSSPRDAQPESEELTVLVLDRGKTGLENLLVNRGERFRSVVQSPRKLAAPNRQMMTIEDISEKSSAELMLMTHEISAQDGKHRSKPNVVFMFAVNPAQSLEDQISEFHELLNSHMPENQKRRVVIAVPYDGEELKAEFTFEDVQEKAKELNLENADVLPFAAKDASHREALLVRAQLPPDIIGPRKAELTPALEALKKYINTNVISVLQAEQERLQSTYPEVFGAKSTDEEDPRDKEHAYARYEALQVKITALQTALDELTVKSLEDNKSKKATLRRLQHILTSPPDLSKRKGVFGGFSYIGRLLLNAVMAPTLILPGVKWGIAKAVRKPESFRFIRMVNSRELSLDDKVDAKKNNQPILMFTPPDQFSIYGRIGRSWEVAPLIATKMPPNEYTALCNAFKGFGTTGNEKIVRTPDIHADLLTLVNKVTPPELKYPKYSAGAWFRLHGKTSLAGEKALDELSKAPGLQKKKNK